MPDHTKSTTKPKTVKNTHKAPKTRKNQPVTFQEALAPAIPLAPTAPLPVKLPGLPRLSNRQLRTSLIIIWALVVITAGAGFGLLLRGRPITTSPTPVPVADANLGIAAASSPAITGVMKQSSPTLKVTSASAVAQAQSGQPFTTANIDTYQPADDSSALQPGYLSAPSPQGTRGTDPVE
jgi:hypothetical protein